MSTQSEAAVQQHGYITEKEQYLQRMKRIEGQARGIAKMIDDEKYCIDILTQISALTRAIQGVATGLLDDHLKHCVLDAAKLGDDAAARAKIQEATDAINRLVVLTSDVRYGVSAGDDEGLRVGCGATTQPHPHHGGLRVSR